MKKLCLCALLALSGCSLQLPRNGPVATPRAVEVPVVNIPRSLREWNWGGGSCVHASTVMSLRWQNSMDMADYWRKTYAGGESYSGLTSKLNRNKVPYYATAGGGGNDVAGMIAGFNKLGGWFGTFTGDVDVLERCTAERRGGVIFYYPNHSILFCGFTPDGKSAIVLDNNRIEQFIEIPRAEFIRKWRGYGGVCIVPTIGNPRPPIPYIVNR